MPGGEVDPRSVQYAAQMKSWSSKSGARPDKHARQQQEQARRYAGLARPLWQLREQMRRQLLLILHWLPATSDLALHCRRLLRNIDRALGCIHSVSAQGHSGGSGGAGGDSSSPPGRGPPVTQMLPVATGFDLGFGRERRAFLQLGGKMMLVAAIGTAIGLNAIPDTAFASQKPKEILKD